MRRTAWIAGIVAITPPVAAQTAPPPVPPLGDLFAPVASAPAAPDADGFLRRWLILEPVAKPNPTNAVFTGTYVRQALSPDTYPGRWAVLPREGQTVRVGDQSLRWHAYDSRIWDVKLFHFAQSLGKPRYGVVFWTTTVVTSPRERRNVRLAVGSNSASRWWLNGANVADLYDDRRMVMDDVLSDRLTLRQGRNILRGAVINGPGLSDFAVRFVDADGKPVRGLTLAVQ
ncbi:acetylxylan esterase [Sphingomonas sp. I4]